MYAGTTHDSASNVNAIRSLRTKTEARPEGAGEQDGEDLGQAHSDSGGQHAGHGRSVGVAVGLGVAHGWEIVDAWKALSGKDPAAMRAQAAVIRKAAKQKLETGLLRGFLFGDPMRFMNDLVMQLELKAAYEEFLQASRARA